MQIKLSIIIPAYNEALRIGALLDSMAEYLVEQNYDYEVIVVDDGSTDNTSEIVAQYHQQFPKLHLISIIENHGKGYAVKQGMLHAKGQYRLFVDADNATRFSDIDKLWPQMEAGYDVVIGSRYLRDSLVHIQQPFYRRLLGRLANLLIQLLAVWGIKDTQCGFKMFRGRVAQAVFSRQLVHRWGFDFEILAISRHLGYTISEVPVSWYHVGASRVRPLKSAFNTLWELLVIKNNLWNGRYD